MKLSGIYGIVNLINRKILIGSSTNILRRWHQHRWDARKGIHPNDYFQKSWTKYGEESFEFRILEDCSVSYLLPREDYWITFHNSKNRDCGFNLQDASIVVHSDETRRKISEIKKGTVITTEVRKKMSDAHKGIYPSKETRIKMGIAQKGRICSEETRRKIGAKHKGKIVTEEVRNKIRKSLKGRIPSEEARIRMSNAHKGKRLSKERKWV